MLRWCSYCQQFLGETPSYEDLSVTHGICPECTPKSRTFSKSDFSHARALQNFQRQLFEAGQRNDLKAAEGVIKSAATWNIRAVDILLGIISPLLYQIGEDWKLGVIGVADEHRFTTFCEAVFERVATTVKVSAATDAEQDGRVEFLLMNAPGNNHVLAVRILALWLQNKGKRARIADSAIGLNELVALIGKTTPRYLLVSMALAEQNRGVKAIAERISGLPELTRPRVVVGGYAVKRGLVSAIPGADLMADISAL